MRSRTGPGPKACGAEKLVSQVQKASWGGPPQLIVASGNGSDYFDSIFTRSVCICLSHIPPLAVLLTLPYIIYAYCPEGDKGLFYSPSRKLHHNLAGYFTTAYQVISPQFSMYLHHGLAGNFTTVQLATSPQFSRQIHHSLTGNFTTMQQSTSPQKNLKIHHILAGTFTTAQQATSLQPGIQIHHSLVRNLTTAKHATSPQPRGPLYYSLACKDSILQL